MGDFEIDLFRLFRCDAGFALLSGTVDLQQQRLPLLFHFGALVDLERSLVTVARLYQGR
ncbi:hypothetical protein D3C81_2142510 [compost metagenome]